MVTAQCSAGGAILGLVIGAQQGGWVLFGVHEAVRLIPVAVLRSMNHPTLEEKMSSHGRKRVVLISELVGNHEGLPKGQPNSFKLFIR